MAQLRLTGRDTCPIGLQGPSNLSSWMYLSTPVRLLSDAACGSLMSITAAWSRLIFAFLSFPLSFAFSLPFSLRFPWLLPLADHV